MPGAGTDKTKDWVERPGPCVILVEPQLADNIGAAARAMANFGLTRLRLVNPREGWPAERAYVVASGAHRILDQAQVYELGRKCDRRPALRVCHHGARARSGKARCAMPDEAARIASGEGRGGRGRRPDVRARAQWARERRGRARRPDHHLAGQSGLRLAQSCTGGGDRRLRMVQTHLGRELPFGMPQKSQAAPRQQLLAFFANLERELEKVEFFRPAGQARDDADQPAQHLLAHAADAAGHPDALRRHHVDRRGPQGTGARWHSG